jgi:phospholipase/carboxylesterase
MTWQNSDLSPASSIMASLESLKICSGQSPNASIIWLHGLGADGYDFAPVIEALQPMPHIRFILPHAPAVPVTINGGYIMPAWYDIYGNDIADRQDEAGIRASQSQIEALIAEEKRRGVAASRILLAGFSQGGAIALHTGLRHAERLAGIMALSTYLPLHEKFPSERSEQNQHMSVFMAHGSFDDIIPLNTAAASKTLLEKLGYAVEWHDYPMPHSLCNEEITDIRDFILRVLPDA